MPVKIIGQPAPEPETDIDLERDAGIVEGIIEKFDTFLFESGASYPNAVTAVEYILARAISDCFEEEDFAVKAEGVRERVLMNAKALKNLKKEQDDGN